MRTRTSATKSPTTRDSAFWKEHGGVALVWSNPQASDSVMIAQALLKPAFHSLLDIAVHFGLTRLENEWNTLKGNIQAAGYPEELEKLTRATPTVERCLRNMHRGIGE